MALKRFIDTGPQRGASAAKLQIFLIVSTCLLYIVAAGLFARAIWYFEQAHWNQVVGADVAELGEGPGSYDTSRSVWHVNVSISTFGQHCYGVIKLNLCSVVAPNSMVVTVGEFSMESWVGRTQRRTARLYRTIYIGSASSLGSSCYGSRRLKVTGLFRSLRRRKICSRSRWKVADKKV